MMKSIVGVVSVVFLMVVGVHTLWAGGKEMLKVGAKAPSLQRVDQQGRTHKLAENRGAFTLVYFYPKDQTPGCTKEACAFRDVWKKYEAAGVKLFGVSKGSVDSLKSAKQVLHS